MSRESKYPHEWLSNICRVWCHTLQKQSKIQILEAKDLNSEPKNPRFQLCLHWDWTCIPHTCNTEGGCFLAPAIRKVEVGTHLRSVCCCPVRKKHTLIIAAGWFFYRQGWCSLNGQATGRMKIGVHAVLQQTGEEEKGKITEEEEEGKEKGRRKRGRRKEEIAFCLGHSLFLPVLLHF